VSTVLKVSLLLASLLAGIGQSFAASVTLAWDLSTDPSVVGYKLYYGGSSRTYTNFVTVGATNSATITGLQMGATYYFAATAFDSAGLESEYSDEISYTIKQAQAVISMSQMVQVFDGKPKTPAVTTQPAGLPVALTYNGTTNSPVYPGSYTVVGKVTDTNYATTYTGTLTIASPANSLVLSWSATTNAVTLYESTNLITWTPVSNAVNPMVIVKTPGAHFYRAGTPGTPIALALKNAPKVVLPSGAVSLSQLVQIYDGKPKTPSVTTLPSGLSVGLTYNGKTNLPVNPGSYQVAAQVTDPNYSGTCAATMTIATTNTALLLSWSVTTNVVTLYESTNLVNWSVVSNATSSMVIVKNPGAHFYRASSSAGNVPLSLRRP
jgi:hypothetical protein